jgi:anti-sigma factor RsiW
MRCSKAHNLISPYIDGELSEREERGLGDHLKACDKCREEFNEMRGLRDLFADAAKFEAPYGFHVRVMANVNTAKVRKLPRILMPVRLTEAVVVLAIIAVGMVSGAFLAKYPMPVKEGNIIIASLHLDLFKPAPPGTLGGAYLAMAEERDEK